MMTNEERKKFSDTLLKEVLERLDASHNFRRQLEGFSTLPPARVADRLVRQFENLLSAQLRELLINLVEQDIRAENEIADAMKVEEAGRLALEQAAAAEKAAEEKSPAQKPAAPEMETGKSGVDELPARTTPPEIFKPAASSGIMEHFGTREAFPTSPIDFTIGTDDWLYLYGFSYAPETSGKGIPSKKLGIKGFDRKNHLFLLDYGDIRFYVSKLTESDYIADKGGRPTLDPQKSVWFKYDHEKVINVLRTAEVLVPLNPWSIFRGLDEVTRTIEDRYLDLLMTLIDAHDATEWEVEVFGYDDHIIRLSVITQAGKVRTSERETRHPASKVRDVKFVERLIFREKTIAQEIHSNLLFYAQRGKLDHLIRLDSAFMNDWKSILVCRYTVQKDKRRKFCEGINSIYETYAGYDLMVRVINPSAFIRLTES
ncbi:MAG TPA: GvpL/GvpF family gas vesicle protein [Bacteroidota bacterium]|nr:GvpL/GvpF family gas vesicle protein [Bacteroidota bacterium]